MKTFVDPSAFGLVPFAEIVEDSEAFLKALLAGIAPAPILFGDNLFFRRETLKHWRSNLSQAASQRRGTILAEASDA